jgi:hypothetical protein
MCGGGHFVLKRKELTMPYTINNYSLERLANLLKEATQAENSFLLECLQQAPEVAQTVSVRIDGCNEIIGNPRIQNLCEEQNIDFNKIELGEISLDEAIEFSAKFALSGNHNSYVRLRLTDFLIESIRAQSSERQRTNTNDILTDTDEQPIHVRSRRAIISKTSEGTVAAYDKIQQGIEEGLVTEEEEQDLLNGRLRIHTLAKNIDNIRKKGKPIEYMPNESPLLRTISSVTQQNSEVSSLQNFSNQLMDKVSSLNNAINDFENTEDRNQLQEIIEEVRSILSQLCQHIEVSDFEENNNND